MSVPTGCADTTAPLEAAPWERLPGDGWDSGGGGQGQSTCQGGEGHGPCDSWIQVGGQPAVISS